MLEDLLVIAIDFFFSAGLFGPVVLTAAVIFGGAALWDALDERFGGMY